MSESYLGPLLKMPTDLPSGAPMFLVPAKAVVKYDERCVTYAWLGNRVLFGEVYRWLLPEYFRAMTHNSGVMIGSFIRSSDVVAGLAYPGDIDVLVIPYEQRQLVLSHVLVIEIKIIRATFLRQSKSPNQFGFSQANALLAAGFPYAAVGHLIVSDRSPQDAWREVGITTILDADSGACAPLRTVKYDLLPSDLLCRSHGRLERNCLVSLGHFSAYLGGSGYWFPLGKPARRNPYMNIKVLDGIYAYYQKNYHHFLWTRRYPPSNPPPPPEKISVERLKQMNDKMRQDFP
jgi:hypothetical protein